VHLQNDLHAALKERSSLSNPIRGKLDLFIRFEIHEDERAVLCIEKTKILEFEIDRLDRFVGAETFIKFAASMRFFGST
jgi:hypothetical protein